MEERKIFFSTLKSNDFSGEQVSVCFFYIYKNLSCIEKGNKKKKEYLRRFGAQTIAKFLVCIFVMEQ